LVCVTIRMLAKGKPLPNACICAPFPFDYLLSLKDDFSDSVINSPLTTNSCELGMMQSTRITIGYVLGGQFSYLRRCGYGIGFCSARLLYKVFRDAQKNHSKCFGFVLIRNTSSHHYRPAVVTIKQDN